MRSSTARESFTLEGKGSSPRPDLNDVLAPRHARAGRRRRRAPRPRGTRSRAFASRPPPRRELWTRGERSTTEAVSFQSDDAVPYCCAASGSVHRHDPRRTSCAALGRPLTRKRCPLSRAATLPRTAEDGARERGGPRQRVSEYRAHTTAAPRRRVSVPTRCVLVLPQPAGAELLIRERRQKATRGGGGAGIIEAAMAYHAP